MGKVQSKLWAMAFALVATSSGTADDSRSELARWIDDRFEEHGLEPGVPVDDATFLRRAHLDLAGRIPSVSEIRDFTGDADANKRQAVVDRLLASERFSEHMAKVWRRILIPAGSASGPAFAATLDEWLAEQFRNNVPYDKLAARLVTAGGAAIERTTPVAYLLSTGGQPATMASSVSRVFLGTRIECAQCHDHPFARWKQADFWGVAAFFAGARLANAPVLSSSESEQGRQQTVDDRGTTISDENGRKYSASLPWRLDAEIQIPEDRFPRQYFAELLTSPENPQFAATGVNRIWLQLCGKGLTASVDDMDQASDDERAVVLDELAAKFAQSGFDVKWLIQAICASQFYQRPSERVPSNAITDRPLKVLSPDQLFDSLEIALSLPISRIDQGPRYNGLRSSLVARMEESLGRSPDEFLSGIPQALTLMNGKLVADGSDLEKSRTLKSIVNAPFLDIEEKIDALFLATLSRWPRQSEKARFVASIQERRSTQEKGEVFSEMMWALINSPEFVLIR